MSAPAVLLILLTAIAAAFGADDGTEDGGLKKVGELNLYTVRNPVERGRYVRYIEDHGENNSAGNSSNSANGTGAANGTIAANGTTESAEPKRRVVERGIYRKYVVAGEHIDIRDILVGKGKDRGQDGKYDGDDTTLRVGAKHELFSKGDKALNNRLSTWATAAGRTWRRRGTPPRPRRRPPSTPTNRRTATGARR